jgi:uncharacterized membrane protein
VNARFLARAALCAAAYAGLTLAPGLNAVAYGPVQFRVSEILTVFACVDPAAVAGTTLGTAIANLASPIAVLDVPFGALLTLAATLAMWRIGPRYVALLVPILVNGFGVAAELALLQDIPYWYGVVFVSLGEAVVLFTGGMVVLMTIRRSDHQLGFLGSGSGRDSTGSAKEGRR